MSLAMDNDDRNVAHNDHSLHSDENVMVAVEKKFMTTGEQTDIILISYNIQ